MSVGRSPAGWTADVKPMPQAALVVVRLETRWVRAQGLWRGCASGCRNDDEQSHCVIAHDDGDDEGDGGVNPEQATGGEDDPTGDRNSGCSGRVGGGIKEDCPHVETAVVEVVDLAAQDEGAHHHHNGGDAADNENR